MKETLNRQKEEPIAKQETEISNEIIINEINAQLENYFHYFNDNLEAIYVELMNSSEGSKYRKETRKNYSLKSVFRSESNIEKICKKIRQFFEIGQQQYSDAYLKHYVNQAIDSWFNQIRAERYFSLYEYYTRNLEISTPHAIETNLLDFKRKPERGPSVFDNFKIIVDMGLRVEGIRNQTYYLKHKSKKSKIRTPKSISAGGRFTFCDSRRNELVNNSEYILINEDK